MADPIYNVLFLCTGNSARSILAEAVLNHLGRPRFAAYSAGSHPTGAVNPFAIATLRKHGIDTDRLRSKSWEEFAPADGNSPAMDLIVTVCDSAAGELCPIWPGHPLTAHWGIADPAAVPGPDSLKRQAFGNTFDALAYRISRLIELPIRALDAASIRQQLNEIGGSGSA